MLCVERGKFQNSVSRVFSFCAEMLTKIYVYVCVWVYLYIHGYAHVLGTLFSEAGQIIKLSFSVYKNEFSFISTCKLSLEQEPPFL